MSGISIIAVGAALITVATVVAYAVLRRQSTSLEWSHDGPRLLALSSVGVAITVVAASGPFALYVAIPVLMAGLGALTATSASDLRVRWVGLIALLLGASFVIGLFLRLFL